jgi:hypothetical protein
MMFHPTGDDDIPVQRNRESPGEFIDRLGGVFYEYAGMLSGVRPDKFKDCLSGGLIRMS